MLRWGMRILAVMALLAGVGWLYRDALVLELIDIATDLRTSRGIPVPTRGGDPPPSALRTSC
jgi:hypothetical protein